MSVAKVLVPIGFSDYSNLLLDYASNLCERINGELHLFHGLEVQGSLKELCDENQFLSFKSKLDEKLRNIADQIKSERSFNVLSKIGEGAIYESVLNYIDEHEIDWLVIGANGSANKKDFIGANTLRILREAKCPAISLKGDCIKTNFNSIVVPLDLTNEVDELLRQVI